MKADKIPYNAPQPKFGIGSRVSVRKLVENREHEYPDDILDHSKSGTLLRVEGRKFHEFSMEWLCELRFWNVRSGPTISVREKHLKRARGRPAIG